MSAQTRLTPSSSQTIGPYFRIGLQRLIDEAPVDTSAAYGVTIRGRVLDRDGTPVPDAMLELWTAGAGKADDEGYPEGFRRAATDKEGNFSVSMWRPVPVEMGGGSRQAPHLLVLFFCRGLLRHLISRVYFDDEPANASDPVLLAVPAARRHTLMARCENESTYRWDVILQGDKETVFFGW